MSCDLHAQQSPEFEKQEIPTVPVNNNHFSNATTHLYIVADHLQPFMDTLYPSSNGYFVHVPQATVLQPPTPG